tara:strand:+ start:152 stop:1591 length:1440 start_codon:yes stop_codon:yes gene_type:complete
MAELNSPISGGIRAVRNTVSSGLFSGAASTPVNQPDSVTTSLLSQNSLGLNTVSGQLSSLTDSIVSLRTSLQLIKNNLETKSVLDRQREGAERNRQRLLAQQSLREGKESAIEKKIQNALVAPLNRIGIPAKKTLNKVGNIFKTLFYGWIGTRLVAGYDAAATKNKEKLKQIGIQLGATILTIGALYVGSKLRLAKLAITLGRIGLKAFKFKSVGRWEPFRKIFDLIKMAAASIAGFEFLFGLKKDRKDNVDSVDDIDGVDNKEDEKGFLEGLNPYPGITDALGEIVGGGSAQAQEINNSDSSTEITESVPQQPKSNGNFLSNLFGRNKNNKKTPRFDASKQYEEGTIVSIGGKYFAKIDKFGVPQPVDSNDSSVDGAQISSSSNLTPEVEPIIKDESSEAVKPLKTNDSTSSKLASLPDPEPIVIPMDGNGGNQPSSSDGSTIAGSTISIPEIPATNIDNTFVYQAYKEYNIVPLMLT